MAQDEVPPQNLPAQPTPDELALRRRVSDQEREQVADLLRDAASEGRLTYTELEDRLESAYGAKTYGELVEVTRDLPGGLVAGPTAAAGPAAQHAGTLTEPGPAINVFLSETKRLGNWNVPRRQEVNAVLGDVTLDYTEAHVPYDQVYVDVKSILADVKIRVPQNAIVHLDSNPILGSVTESQRALGAGDHTPATPPKVFHIRGTAILGEIKIKRGPPPHQTPRPRLTALARPRTDPPRGLVCWLLVQRQELGEPVPVLRQEPGRAGTVIWPR